MHDRVRAEMMYIFLVLKTKIKSSETEQPQQ